MTVRFTEPTAFADPAQRDFLNQLVRILRNVVADQETATKELKGDVDALSFTATNISYDNSTSGLTATDVQTAIDELVIDSIADSDVNHAPSRNAVFDALALKQPLDATLTALAGLTIAQGDLILGTGVDTFTVVPKNTSATRYFANTGTSNAGQWDQVNLANGVTGTLASANLANGVLIQSVSATYTSNAALSTALPYDDTIPQNNEGDEVVTVTITPTSTTSVLEITFSSIADATNPGSAPATAALFQDSTANALQVATTYTSVSSVLSLVHRMAAGTTSSTTFKIRVGAGTGSAILNGLTSGRKFGGAASAILIVREYKG